MAAAAFALASLAAAPQDSSKPAVQGRETLDYAIEWRLIPAGTAKMTSVVAPRSSSGSGASSEVRLHLESAGLVSRLFRVSDDYTVLMGQNLCAQNSFLAAHEGNRSRETRVAYDAQTRRASYIEKDLVHNSTMVSDAEIPSCVHDVVGALLVLRNLRLEPGKTAQIPISDGKKFVQAKVESQRREELKTDLSATPVKTILYEVFLFDNVLFKRSGHLHVWLTDDDRRLPVQLQVRLQFTIGTITFRLLKAPAPEGG